MDNNKYKNDEKIGDYIRIANWNINRGMNLNQIKQAFADPDSLFLTIKNPDKNIGANDGCKCRRRKDIRDFR